MTSPSFLWAFFHFLWGTHWTADSMFAKHKLKTVSKKKYWLKCSFQLWLGDLPLQQQVVNLWHYCIFPPSYWNWNLQTEPLYMDSYIDLTKLPLIQSQFLLLHTFQLPTFPYLFIFFLLTIITGAMITVLFCMTILEIYEA